MHQLYMRYAMIRNVSTEIINYFFKCQTAAQIGNSAQLLCSNMNIREHPELRLSLQNSIAYLLFLRFAFIRLIFGILFIDSIAYFRLKRFPFLFFKLQFRAIILINFFFFLLSILHRTIQKKKMTKLSKSNIWILLYRRKKVKKKNCCRYFYCFHFPLFYCFFVRLFSYFISSFVNDFIT